MADTLNTDNIELKTGLTYISDRNSQLRYSDLEGKEQWIQQTSRYKALVPIKRGQAVSIATAKEFKEYAKKICTENDVLDEERYNSFLEDPDSYLVLTDTSRHLRSIGLALEPADVGEEIHILGSGTFTYSTKYENLEGHQDKEYNPKFTYDDVGKRVYVASPVQTTSVDGEVVTHFCGEITVDESLTLKQYQNVICIGYLTDAPQEVIENGEKRYIGDLTKVEVSISGDQRGILDSTQFEGILGEDVVISEDDPIRLFAFGKESDTNFKTYIRLTPQNDYNEQGEGNPFTSEDFIAIQKLDGKTAYIYPTLNGEDTFDLDSVQDDDDRAFIHLANVYNTINGVSEDDCKFPVGLNDKQLPNSVNENLNNLKTVLQEAFRYVSGFESTYEVVQAENNDYVGSITLSSSEPGGYFTVHISKTLANKFAGSYTQCYGSYENKGKLVLADIRIPERRDLLGVYYGNVHGTLKKDYRTVFLRLGEFTLPENLQERVSKMLYSKSTETSVYGNYYLGFNGQITNYPIWTKFETVNKVAYLKEKNKIVFDIGNSTRFYDGNLPVGYIKPAVQGTDNNYYTEYGYLLMDGVSEYPKEGLYETLYQRLLGWYPAEELNVDGDTDKFVIPKYCNITVKEDENENGIQVEHLCQIKYASEGIFEELPKIPFLRLVSKFDKETVSDDIHDTTPVKPSINDYDISALVDYSVNDGGYQEYDISKLDIHLYVDPNPNYVSGPHDWHEIKEGFFNYNNTVTYGFNWKITKTQPDAYSKPYGGYLLSTDIGEGEGIAYVQGNNQAPLKLNDCAFKLYVSKREYHKEQFDIEGIYKNFISNSVYTDETESKVVLNKAVSGKAVLDAIANKLDLDRMTANEDAEIHLGKFGRLTKEISLGAKENVSIVGSNGVIISNVFDDPNTVTPSPKVIFRDDVLHTEEYGLGENIYKTNSNGDFLVEDDIIPTVGEIREHAAAIIPNAATGGKTYPKDYANQNNAGGYIHGMIFGGEGNLDVRYVSGIEVKTSSINKYNGSSKLGTNLSYIPIAYKDTNDSPYVAKHEGEDKYIRIIKGTSGLQDTEDELLTKSVGTDSDGNIIENKKVPITKKNFTESIKKGSVGYNTVYSFDSNGITFNYVGTDNNSSLANITAANIESGSLSKYKKIYGELVRDANNGNIEWTELAENSVRYNETTNSFNSILGSALQAAYELPMAYWQYNTEKDWYKKTVGVIVERVNDVVDKFNTDVSRKLFSEEELTGSDYKDKESDTQINEFKYSNKEVDSIKEYLNSIISNSSNGVNITSMVGILFKAAKETQERLLKVEASTFGADYKTIPGERDSFDIKGLNGVVADPTNYGLNRLIRAICLELYNTANPFDIESMKQGDYTTTSLSRIDHLDRDIHGYVNGEDDNTSVSSNLLSEIDSSTYPYNDVVFDEKTIEENGETVKVKGDVTELRESEFSSTESEVSNKGINVATRVDMMSPDSDVLQVEDNEGNKLNSNNFNGVVDAIYRITTKLNALTVSVNGTDNIANAPLRLNTLRQNVEHIIRETYFDDAQSISVEESELQNTSNTLPLGDKDKVPYGELNVTSTPAEVYHDTNDNLNSPYMKDDSRMDRLSTALYNFIIKQPCSEQEFGGFGSFETHEEIVDNNPTQIVDSYYTKRKFNGKHLIVTKDSVENDFINTPTDTEITAKKPNTLNDYEYATIIDVIIDALGSEYYRKNKSVDDIVDNDKKWKETYRHNRTISQRLDEIETALDRVVLKLSRRHHFENDTDSKTLMNNDGNNIYNTYLPSVEYYGEFLSKYLGVKFSNITDNVEENGTYNNITTTYANGLDQGQVDQSASDLEATETTAEWAFNKKKKIHAGLVNTLYRLQNEEKKTTVINAFLGTDFDSESIKEQSNITVTENAADLNSEDSSRSYNIVSAYNLTDDIRDILRTLYGSDNPQNDVDNNNPTVFKHRSLYNETGFNANTRFVKADGRNNIIDKIINEMYYLPQPIRHSGLALFNIAEGQATTNDTNPVNVKDSRTANYFDFDCGNSVYDIPTDSAALTDLHLQEFFNDISRGTDSQITSGSTNHYRYSRFEVIEKEIRQLRSFLGLNVNISEIDKQATIELKYQDKLKFIGSDLGSYNFSGFGNVSSLDDATNQFNMPQNDDAVYTSVLSFLLNNDKSNRCLRNELGLRNTVNKYFENGELKVNTFSTEGDLKPTKTVYDRLSLIDSYLEGLHNWRNLVKGTGTGEIFNIFNALGNNNLNAESQMYTFNNWDICNLEIKPENKSVENTYTNIWEELSNHHSNIRDIQDIIGVNDIKKENSGFTSGDTIWGILKEVRHLNSNDVSSSNVVSWDTESDKETMLGDIPSENLGTTIDSYNDENKNLITSKKYVDSFVKNTVDTATEDLKTKCGIKEEFIYSSGIDRFTVKVGDTFLKDGESSETLLFVNYNSSGTFTGYIGNTPYTVTVDGSTITVKNGEDDVTDVSIVRQYDNLSKTSGENIKDGYGTVESHSSIENLLGALTERFKNIESVLGLSNSQGSSKSLLERISNIEGMIGISDSDTGSSSGTNTESLIQ